MRSSIRTRLLITFIALAAIPLLLVGIGGTLSSFSNAEESSVQNQFDEATLVSTQVTGFVSALETQLHVLIQTGRLRSQLVADQQAALSNLLSYQNDFDRLSLLDANGKEQAKVSRLGVLDSTDLVDQSKAAEFTSPSSTGKTYYGPVEIEAATGEPYMTMAVPMNDLRSGQLAGVVVAQVRFKPIWDIVANFHTGQTDIAYIMDASGRVIAHPDPSVVLANTHYTIPTNLHATVTGLAGTSAIIGTDDIQLGDQHFTVAVEAPASEALGPAIQQLIYTVLIILVVVVLAVAIGIVTVRRLVRPVQSLAATAEAIAAGDLGRQAEVVGHDEIASMATAFNKMTAQLQQTLKGLQDHVDELEKARVEREKLIKDLQAAKRLADENSRLKSEFLSTMSHELRTPLNAIEGFTGIILNKIGGTDFNPKTEGYLVRIRANSKRLLQLINDFLDLSRVEAGRLELANQPFNPSTLARRWQDEIGVLAEKKGIQLEVSVDSTIPDSIYGDEEAVSKIALNLLGNAIKFTEQGQVKLAIERSNGSWGFSVEDTGIGIPPHAREFIFEEFRQVDQTSKRKFGGTGLGLAIVQKYARAMGGTVNVKSELGKGSTFTVSLPMKTTA